MRTKKQSVRLTNKNNNKMERTYKPEISHSSQNKEHKMPERQLYELRTEDRYLQWRKERILEKMEYMNEKPKNVNKVAEWLEKWFK